MNNVSHLCNRSIQIWTCAKLFDLCATSFIILVLLVVWLLPLSAIIFGIVATCDFVNYMFGLQHYLSFQLLLVIFITSTKGRSIKHPLRRSV